GIGCSPAVSVPGEARDGAIVNHESLFVTPAAVDNLSDGDLVDVARDDAIYQARRVRAGDHVLIKRGDVDQRRRIADSVVLVLVVRLVSPDRVIARPLAVLQAWAEREGSLVKCGSDWQISRSCTRVGL